MPRGRPEFESSEAGAKAAKLKKFSDAGEVPLRHELEGLNSVVVRRR